MRQVGIVANEQEALRFASYLITQGISAKPDEEQVGWAVWVHEENHVVKAREEFDQFRADPNHDRYCNLEAKATAIVKEEEEKRSAARRNTVDVRQNWDRGARKRAPFIMTLLVISCVVTLVIGFGRSRQRDPKGFGAQTHNALEFADSSDFRAAGYDGLVNIKQGEVWRLVTPIFIHLDEMHLLFNMVMLVILGRLLEPRFGAVRLALMVLAIAVVSNVCQALAPESIAHVLGGGGPRFGGMSGVVYGLFGFIWIYGTRHPASGLMIAPSMVFIMLMWIGLGVAGVLGNIANIAHIAGLLSGVGIAQLVRSPA